MYGLPLSPKASLRNAVVLVTCEFENRDFILTRSTNLESFQLTAFILMGTACWPVERGEEKGEQSIVLVAEEECQGRRENLAQLMFDLCSFTLCDLFFSFGTHLSQTLRCDSTMNSTIPVHVEDYCKISSFVFLSWLFDNAISMETILRGQQDDQDISKVSGMETSIGNRGTRSKSDSVHFVHHKRHETDLGIESGQPLQESTQFKMDWEISDGYLYNDTVPTVQDRTRNSNIIMNDEFWRRWK